MPFYQVAAWTCSVLHCWLCASADQMMLACTASGPYCLRRVCAVLWHQGWVRRWWAKHTDSKARRGRATQSQQLLLTAAAAAGQRCCGSTGTAQSLELLGRCRGLCQQVPDLRQQKESRQAVCASHTANGVEAAVSAMQGLRCVVKLLGRLGCWRTDNLCLRLV